MFRHIAFAVFLRGHHFKGLIVPEHCEDDVADLVHHGPDRHVLFLGFAFVCMVTVDDRIYRPATALVQFQVVEGHHMQDAPGKAGSPFGHMHLVPDELSRLRRSVISFPGMMETFREAFKPTWAAF